MIAIIGGGNMGSLLAVKFSQKCDVSLYLGSNSARTYCKDMFLYNEDRNEKIVGKIKNITNDLETAIKGAEYVFITYPPFLFETLANDLIPLLVSGQNLVFVPGSGCAELFFKEVLEKGCTITGLQRVHSVARIIEKGKSVRESGVRNSIRIASIPKSFGNEAKRVLESLYSLDVELVDNYLDITLINSNSILHTSRLYCIFKDFSFLKSYDSLPLFYEDWNNESSILLEQMDKELFSIIDVLNHNGIVVNGITPLLKHYESSNCLEMTNKIKSINSLKGLGTPSCSDGYGGLLPNLESRYFTADFPYGLDILLAFSLVVGVEAPNMKKVSEWYHNITDTKSWFKLSRFEINTIQDIHDYYLL